MPAPGDDGYRGAGARRHPGRDRPGRRADCPPNPGAANTFRGCSRLRQTWPTVCARSAPLPPPTARTGSLVRSTLTDPEAARCSSSTKSRWRCSGRHSGATELSSQLFTVQWEPAPLDKAAGTLDGLLLIGDATATTRCCPRCGHRCATASPKSSWCRPPTPRSCARRSPERVGQHRRGLPAANRRRVAARAGQLELAQARTLLIADIAKTLARMGARNSPRLWIVTRGAQHSIRRSSHLGADAASRHRAGADIRASGTEDHDRRHRRRRYRLACRADRGIARRFGCTTRSRCATGNATSTDWCPRPSRRPVISSSKLAARW